MFFGEKFHRSESRLCLLAWISAVLYAMYQFSQTSSTYFQLHVDHYEDFEAGWPILSPANRDKADFEWETLRYFVGSVFPMLFVYTLTGAAMPGDQMYRVTVSLLCLICLMGFKVTLLALVQPALFCLVGRFRRKPLIWGCNLVCLGLIATFRNLCTSEVFLKDLNLDQFTAYLTVLLLYWMNLKCTAFYLTDPPCPVPYLQYCFYPPNLFTGPFISCKDFNSLPQPSVMIRLKQLVFDLARCMFWMVFLDFSLHFIYVNATMFQLKLVQQLDLWALCGYGYLMGQFFHVKYVVQYGLSTSLAAFDGVTVPRLPRCIGRVHLYSDMWKYFDPGLYEFLKTFIYIPSLQKGLNNLEASFLCFSFVFVWHGIEQYILIWAALNFLGVTLEAAMGSLYATKLQKFECFKGERTMRRLGNLAAAPLLALSAISNFYFFAGKEVGDIFVQRILGESPANQALLISVLYCCCEVSMELRQVQSGRMGLK